MKLDPLLNWVNGSAASVKEGLSIRLLNLQSISCVYGEVIALVVTAELCARSRAFCDDMGLVVSVSLEGPNIRLAGLPVAPPSSGRCAVLEGLLCALASRPVFVEGYAILVALSAQTEDSDALPASALPFRLNRQQYLGWMAEAAAAFEAMAEERLFLSFQPIRAIEDQELLYQECLSRITPRPGNQEVISPASFIPAIESLGLVRLFDRFVVHATISALRTAPSSWRLGCNISAQSAVDDSYWVSVFDTLAAEPDLAKRLIVEITETSPLPDLDRAHSFVLRLHQLGCLVALDDFGSGFRSIREAIVLAPDIVKVDRFFLTSAVKATFGNAFLSNLVALSSSLAKHVVVEGVEDERGMTEARVAGARWVQGYHLGEPLGLHARSVSPAASAIETASLSRDGLAP